MKTKFAPLCLFSVLLVFLASCRLTLPSVSNEHVEDLLSSSTSTTTATTTSSTTLSTTTTSTTTEPKLSTATTDPQGTSYDTGTKTTYVTKPYSILTFSSLEDYKETLLSFTSSDVIYQALLDASSFTFCAYEEPDFAMLLEKHFFLVPILPAGNQLTKATFSNRGVSEFSVTLENGDSIFFNYQHGNRVPADVEDSERKILMNSRGITICHDHIYYSSIDAHSGRYTWQEGEYYCRMTYQGSDTAAYDAFIKELTFEEVLLDT